LPRPYEGQHAFTFLYRDDEVPPPTVVTNLQDYIDPDVGPVFFAAVFEGDFQGFAHIAADDAGALGDLIAGPLWNAGIRSHHVAEGRVYRGPIGPMGPTRSTPRFLAICRVSVNQPPLQVMRNIAVSFNEELPFVGASTVIAGFHLLVELGDDDGQALSEHVASLRGIDGVRGVEVAVTDTGPTQGA
jgi:hypothetical protein